jgi:hypothetical protein
MVMLSRTWCVENTSEHQVTVEEAARQSDRVSVKHTHKKNARRGIKKQSRRHEFTERSK